MDNSTSTSTENVSGTMAVDSTAQPTVPSEASATNPSTENHALTSAQPAAEPTIDSIMADASNFLAQSQPATESEQAQAEASSSQRLPQPQSPSVATAQLTSDAAIDSSGDGRAPPAQAAPLSEQTTPSQAAQAVPEAAADEAKAVTAEFSSTQPSQSVTSAEPVASQAADTVAPGPSAANNASTATSEDPKPVQAESVTAVTSSATEPASTVSTTTDPAPAPSASANALPSTTSTSTIEPSASSSVPHLTSATALPSAQSTADAGAPVPSSNEEVPTSKEASGSASEPPKRIEAVASLSESAPATKGADTNDVAPQPAAATMTVTPKASTTAANADSIASAGAPTSSTAEPSAPAESKKAAGDPSQSASSTIKSQPSGSGSAATSSGQQPEAEAKADDVIATATAASSKDAAAGPGVEAVIASDKAAASLPATPEKKVTSTGQPNASLPSTPAREGRVALILRINKELIRLCVELQGKELTTDAVYREAAVRLQANLAYLASIADKAGKPIDATGRSPPGGALPKLEPFPRSEHAPSSPIPALYEKLIAIFGAAHSHESPSADGRKRSRDSTADLANDDSRKRAASRGIDRSQDVSAAGTPTSQSNQSTNANAAATAASTDAAADLTLSGTSQQQPSAPQAPQSQQQQQQTQQQLQGKGPDLSLAPPVPIAPPGAAQNIPNNPQAQALMQAFGPNALVNLHALQSHLRGQGTHPWVAYMEANFSGFKGMSLQVQLQHMTSLQNAALQRQKAMQQAGGGAGSAGSTSGVGSPATMQMPNGGMGSVSSPATTRPVSRHSDSPGQAQASPSASGFGGNVPGRTGTPLGGQAPFSNRPGSSGSVGSMTSAGGRNRTGSSHLAFDPSQMQSVPSPATMATMGDFASQQQGGMPNFGFQPPALQQGSPAAASSPGQQMQPGQQPQQAQQPQGMMMGGINMNMPNFQSLPPHLQQQIRQQYMAHVQAQAARGMNQQQAFNPQQQQQQPGWNFQSPQ